MHTLKPDVIAHTLKKMQAYITKSVYPIDRWSVVYGKHSDFGPTKFEEESRREIHPGDRFRSGYDDTFLFTATVTVPKEMDGCKVYLKADIGGESLVKVNGTYVSAFSSEHHQAWTYRTECLLSDSAKAGEVLSIEIENTVCCGMFCDEAMAGAKNHRYTMGECCLFSVYPEVEAYWFETNVLFHSLDCISDDVIRTKVYNAIDDSVHTPDYDMGKDRFAASIPAALEVLHKGLEGIRYEPQGEVVMVGHSHLDIAWLWTSRELSRKTARTFVNTLNLMENYKDFKYTQSQAIVYDYMKKYYPGIFEQVREAVRDGRWEIVGNAWVEADTNIASGESLIRQLLYGRKFFMSEFGVSSDTYWLPDCFGFTWALPQIIKRSGMKYFATSKLNNNDTNPFPYTVFNWKGHTGDEIIAYVNRAGYQGEYDTPYIRHCFEANDQKAVTEKSMGMFGYGDGGGGSTYAQLERAKYLPEVPGIPKAHIGTTKEFFAGLEEKRAELPVWDGDMYYENHRGTYTSQHFVKKNNRFGERALRRTEIMKNLFGMDFITKDELDSCWKILLTNQFHDILPGTSIHEVFDDVRRDYAKLNNRLSEFDTAVAEYFEGLDAGPCETAIVYNFLPFERSGITELNVKTPNPAAYTREGRELASSYVQNDDGTCTLRFMAEKVPGTGFRMFFVRSAETAEAGVWVTTKKLENKYLRVSFDNDGNIVSVYDKENDREVLSGTGNELVVFTDKCVHETAWNLEADYRKKRYEMKEAESVEVYSANAVEGAVRVVRRVNNSVITQIIRLGAESRRIDFDTTVDWQETEKVLKAFFPVTVRNREATYEMAHGVVTHPTHTNTSYDLAQFEVCGHSFADLSEGDYGVSILNNCKYGYDIHNDVMSITLLRSPTCPDVTADKGVWSFTYSLYPHTGGWNASTLEEAHSLNEPLKAYRIPAGAGDGIEPSVFSAVRFSRDDIVLDCFKEAEDGDGYILRFYECKQARGNVTVTVAGGLKRAVECNMMEENERELTVTEGCFDIFIKPFEVKTVRLTK